MDLFLLLQYLIVKKHLNCKKEAYSNDTKEICSQKVNLDFFPYHFSKKCSTSITKIHHVNSYIKQKVDPIKASSQKPKEFIILKLLKMRNHSHHPYRNRTINTYEEVFTKR